MYNKKLLKFDEENDQAKSLIEDFDENFDDDFDQDMGEDFDEAGKDSPSRRKPAC